MKTLNTILLAVGALVGATVGTPGLYAQTRAVANIPFDFTVSTAKMPAGEYTFKCTSSPCQTLQIVNQETRKSVMVLIHDKNAPQDNDGSNGKVTFHRYEDRYYFASVWTPSGLAAETTPSAQERELRASNGQTQLASVEIPLTETR